jgi:purine-nucleoside phosphorylase
MDSTLDAAIDALRAHALDSLPPLAIVLGFGAFATKRATRPPLYLDIPGFPIPSVEGHAGRLVVG